jgi:hypothetical protein
MTHLLLYRPIPYADETAASLLIRAAGENGHKNVYQLLASGGIQINETSLRACLVDPTRYQNIVQSLGLAYDAALLALKRLRNVRHGPRIYRSVSISNVCFRRDDASAFCSHCLIEAPYWRQQWLIRPFSACVKHQRLLVDHCLSCGKIPSIGRAELTQCNHCKSSLLEMQGDPICANAMRSIEHMLNAEAVESLKMVLEFWEALWRFDGLGAQPETENIRLTASLAFAMGTSEAENYVATRVRERLSSQHPRIQLLPFLVASARLKRFAERVIDTVPPMPKIGNGTAQLSKLSKSSVCNILGITSAKLTQMIEDGTFIWPESGGRMRKIDNADVELRLHGFSVAEQEIAHSLNDASRPQNGASMAYKNGMWDSDQPDDDSNGPACLTWEPFWRGSM